MDTEEYTRTSQLYSRLYRMCQRNQHALLSRGLASLDGRGGLASFYRNRNLLHIAAHLGHLESIQVLLRNGYSIDMPLDNQGHTALTVACKSPKLRTMEKRLVMQQLMKWNASFGDGVCLLVALTTEQHVSITELLMEAGCSPNAVSRSRESLTALDKTIMFNLPQQQLLLLEHGARADKSVETAMTCTNGPMMRRLVQMGARIPEEYEYVASKRDPVYFGRKNIDVLVSAICYPHLERRLCLLDLMDE